MLFYMKIKELKKLIPYILEDFWNACMHHPRACFASNLPQYYWKLWEQSQELSPHFTNLCMGVVSTTICWNPAWV